MNSRVSFPVITSKVYSEAPCLSQCTSGPKTTMIVAMFTTDIASAKAVMSATQAISDKTTMTTYTDTALLDFIKFLLCQSDNCAFRHHDACMHLTVRNSQSPQIHRFDVLGHHRPHGESSKTEKSGIAGSEFTHP